MHMNEMRRALYFLILGKTSTMDVIIVSSEANSESSPSASIITKNMIDQNGAPANCVTANGNTIKDKPEPDETTSLTS